MTPSLSHASVFLRTLCSAEDSFKCYAIHTVRLSTEAEQYVISPGLPVGARPELDLNTYNRRNFNPDRVFVYKRHGDSEARVLVVELKYAAEARPSRRSEKTAHDAVYKAISSEYGAMAKEYAEAVTGEEVDPLRVTLLGIAVMGAGLSPSESQLTVKFDSISLV